MRAAYFWCGDRARLCVVSVRERERVVSGGGGVVSEEGSISPWSEWAVSQEPQRAALLSSSLALARPGSLKLLPPLRAVPAARLPLPLPLPHPSPRIHPPSPPLLPLAPLPPCRSTTHTTPRSLSRSTRSAQLVDSLAGSFLLALYCHCLARSAPRRPCVRASVRKVSQRADPTLLSIFFPPSQCVVSAY